MAVRWRLGGGHQNAIKIQCLRMGSVAVRWRFGGGCMAVRWRLHGGSVAVTNMSYKCGVLTHGGSWRYGGGCDGTSKVGCFLKNTS